MKTGGASGRYPPATHVPTPVGNGASHISSGLVAEIRLPETLL